MNWGEIADTAGLVCLLAGALLSLSAAMGLLRFPDLLSRMHAATKPQVLGLLLTLLGVGLQLRNGLDSTSLLLVGMIQMLTQPVAAHMVARSAYRTGQARECRLVIDEVTDPRNSGHPSPLSSPKADIRDGGPPTDRT